METLDNKDRVDLNSQPGTVVTASAQPTRLQHALAGALKQKNFESIRGQLVDGVLDATLQGRDDTARVTYRETPTEVRVAVESREGSGYTFHPGTLTVVQDKATGSMTLEQQQDFPWEFSYSPSIPEQEAHFGPAGPASQAEVRFYQQGQGLENLIEKEIAKIKALDNGPQDLNPQAGLVVAAGLGNHDSDTPVYSHMAGDYPVPTEAMLKFDPLSGQVSEFSRGFGEHNLLSYRFEGDAKIYQRNEFLNCDQLEVKADGSRFQQHFKEARMAGKAATYQQEHKVTTAVLPRFFEPKNALAAVGWSAVVGTLVGLLTPGTTALAITTGLMAATATAGVVGAVKMPKIDLNVGVNRFAGSDHQGRFSNAHKAYKDFLGSLHNRARTEDSPQGTTREKALQFLNRQDTGYRGENLLILCDKLGDKAEPALVVVSKDFHYPVRLQETGIELPGGTLVPFESIRAMSDCG
jgi:hypothetical protein